MLRRAIVELALMALVVCVPSRAEDPAEVARIHLAAIGGRARVDALSSYRATGRLLTGDQPSELTVIAARPNRLRVEVRRAGRVTIQGSDGVNPPWQTDVVGGATQTVSMNPTAADGFRSEAEFDDPLVAAGEFGYEFDDAGVASMDGRPLRRLLVTQRLTKTFYLLIDPQTYFIAARIDETVSGLSQKSSMVTRYADVRPVAGVLLPHVITVLLNDKPARTAVFEHVEPNPPLSPGVFTRPGSSP